MKPFIATERFDGYIVATLNAPETRNTLGAPETFDAIEKLCAEVAADRDVRALILTGAGKAFCAGGDIKQMLARSRDPDAEPIDERYGYKEGFHRIPRALYELEVPTIAAVNGPAIGAGLDLACMCDIRIASSQARFAESFVTIGIIPGDGGAWLLPRIVGPSRAAEMTFTGAAIDADEALAYGLVSRVVPPEALLDEAKALAQKIAANPGHVLRMAKRLMHEGQHTRLDASLELAGSFQALAHFTREHRERIEQAVGRLSPSAKGPAT